MSRNSMTMLIAGMIVVSGSHAYGDEPCVIFEWRTVCDVGNEPDSTSLGSVDSCYRIGAREVTNAQYAAFLNAVAADDTHELYHLSMSDPDHGGIVRNGSAGSYSYSTELGRESYPVTFVSWYDTLRFANWLENGQPTGMQDTSTTEDGAYDMSRGDVVERETGAHFFLPSEDQWYKAAFYKGGSTDAGYWEYATRSDAAPIAELPTCSSNSANYDQAVGTVTNVGVYLGSVSAYGTYDQNGNVWEWNQALRANGKRGTRGGSWSHEAECLRASSPCLNELPPGTEAQDVGFRVASLKEESCVADFNDDGVVGPVDLATLLASWGPCEE